MFVLALCQALVSTTLLPSRDSPLYLDPSKSAEDRAQDLLKRMTWEEKIGQMGGNLKLASYGPIFNESSFEKVNKTQNGIIGFGDLMNPPLKMVPYLNTLRTKQVNSTRLGIPYVTVSDSMNSIYLTNGTLFPAALSMASSWNLPLYGDAVAAIRDELLSLGVRWVLSPELDVAKDPRNGRVGEMYGEDPYLVGEFGTKYVKTMQEKDEKTGYVKVATTIKHFVYGQSSGGVNEASMYGGINHIFNDLGSPFIKVIRNANPMSLMTSYATVDGVPMTANEYMIQTVLRDAMKFDGAIMSDAVAIEYLYTISKVASSMADAGLLALRAGVQLEITLTQPAVFPSLLEYGNDSSIVELVNKAVFDLLKIKFGVGEFDLPLPTIEGLSSTLRAPKHLELSRDMARESLVLLQNDGLLPLKLDNATKIALLGPFADIINPGSYAPAISEDRSVGNSLRTSLINKLGSSNVNFVKTVDIIDTTDDTIDVAVSAAKSAGLAILMLGSLSANPDDPNWVKRTDGEYFSHPDLGFPGLQQKLLDAVLDTGVTTVLILSGGQAFYLQDSTLRANAIVHSFLGGEFTGDALAEIIFGEVNPSGKLTVSLPQASGAWPIAYDFLNSDNYNGYRTTNATFFARDWQFPVLERTPPMAFGFGLSYTTFSISTPTAMVTKDKNGEQLVRISASVTNSGGSAGKEVVQLYFRQKYTHIVETPNKQLIRFEKIGLEQGQTQNVTFEVPHSELGYYFNMEWKVNAGDFIFWLGSSSKSADLKTVNVTLL
ncbi:glycoside hydrolase superfamily [Annulohypoxylon moriforme]|nr:glycoside hydrolase superfamily [Annulohypoxylon moriforme]